MKNRIKYFSILLFVFLLIIEIYFIVKRFVVYNKKPEIINSWQRIPSGLTSIAVFSNNFYVVNNTRGEIFQYDKNTGKNLYVFNFMNGVFGVAESSNGKIFVLHKDNSISIFSNNYKLINRFELDSNNSSFFCIDLDSQDNIYIFDIKSHKIHKFSSDMKKIYEFSCINNEKICPTCYVSRIVVTPNDEIYYLQNITEHKAFIKIFDLNGNIKKTFWIRHTSKFSNLENIAISSDGHLYMNNFHEKQIVVYDGLGRYKGVFFTDIKKQYLIEYPGSICGDKQGSLFYVATDKIAIFKYIKY